MKKDGFIKEMGFAMRVLPLKIRTEAGRRVLLRPVVAVAALALAAFLHAGAFSAHAAAPKADLWPRWQANDPRSTIEIDHSAWAAFLEKFILKSPDGVNRLAYGAVKEGDRRRLWAYIDRLAAAPVSRLRRAEQFAYWVNLYNALTVKAVLEHFPTESILDISISPGWFSFGPWDKKLLAVEGEKISLNDIEHRILRPIWRDPRIHYAVNCASIGCPNLDAAPYAAARYDAQLNKAARAYINHPRGARFGASGLFSTEGLIVSSIYDWYRVDFGGTDAGVIRHLKKYASPALAERLGRTSEIEDYEYDWRLNLAPSAPARAGAN